MRASHWHPGHRPGHGEPYNTRPKVTLLRNGRGVVYSTTGVCPRVHFGGSTTGTPRYMAAAMTVQMEALRIKLAPTFHTVSFRLPQATVVRTGPRVLRHTGQQGKAGWSKIRCLSAKRNALSQKHRGSEARPSPEPGWHTQRPSLRPAHQHRNHSSLTVKPFFLAHAAAGVQTERATPCR